MTYTHRVHISFGDCDPAGIVYYPNFYRWFDATCHAWFNRFGGHKSLVNQFGAIGIGIIDSGATFLRPGYQDDILDITLTVTRWTDKRVHIAYHGTIDGKTVAKGFEVRGILVRSGGRLTTVPIAPLRELAENATSEISS